MRRIEGGEILIMRYAFINEDLTRDVTHPVRRVPMSKSKYSYRQTLWGMLSCPSFIVRKPYHILTSVCDTYSSLMSDEAYVHIDGSMVETEA